MSKQHEQKVLEAIVNHIPVADVPELIQHTYIPTNPFDQHILVEEIMADLIRRIQSTLKIRYYVEFKRLTNSYVFYDWSNPEESKERFIDRFIYTKIEQSLLEAGYTRRIEGDYTRFSFNITL